jgi:hypothetical protein
MLKVDRALGFGLQREPDKETRTLPHFGLKPDLALMLLDYHGVCKSQPLPRALANNFGGKERLENTGANLKHAIESTITIARNEWKYVADVETSYDPSLPRVSCLPGE